MPTWLSLVGTIVQYNIREQASIDGALKEDLHQRIAGDCNIMEHRIGEETPNDGQLKGRFLCLQHIRQNVHNLNKMSIT
jgi:hypothetical protein